MTWIVRLAEQKTCYGPFADESTARDFAAYLTAEVDPAEVCKLCDPVADLLSFRSQFMAGDKR